MRFRSLGFAATASLVALPLLGTGCLQTSTQPCENGLICPSGRACHPDPKVFGCVDPAAITPECEGGANYTPCELPGAADNENTECRLGVCVIPGCGDGVAEFGEQCDDGNRNAGDGCSATCAIEEPYSCDGEPSECVPQSIHGFTLTEKQALDLIIVVDRAEEMNAHNEAIRKLGRLFDNLAGGRVSLRVGVISSDMGAGGHDVGGCTATGDDAQFLSPAICAAGGQRYLVDYEPRGCRPEYDFLTDTCTAEAYGDCLANFCNPGEPNCPPPCDPNDPNDPGCIGHPCDQPGAYPADLVQDASSRCPRCRNFGPDPLDSVVECILELPSRGCTFPQPFKALRKAIEEDLERPMTERFLREYSTLGVIFVTNGDDCSANRNELFDPDYTSGGPAAPFGRPTRFRCFAAGIECDQDPLYDTGVLTNCDATPSADVAADNWLVPVDDYVNFIEGLRGEETLFVAALAGPIINNSALIGVDEALSATDLDELRVEHSCGDDEGGATPSFRIRYLISALTAQQRVAAQFKPVCSSPGLTLYDFGLMIQSRFKRCLEWPVAGCTDPGAQYGEFEAWDNQPCNDTCQPTCLVEDDQGEIPPCSDPSLAGYQLERTESGRPTEVQSGLPVRACWYIDYDFDRCTLSNGAALGLVRQEQGNDGALIEVHCDATPRFETDCDDGIDNDGDCLIDAADTDDCGPGGD